MKADFLLLPLFLLIIGCVALPGSPAQKEIPRPEHPNPQFRREAWQNLNGQWEFAETDDDQDESFLTGRKYPDRITVPFCRESSLSGLGRKGFVRNVWYRRRFSVPTDWRSERQRVIFHVGACDWLTRVWVNGKLQGSHVGGSAPFSFDVTAALLAGENTVVIHAFDDPRSGLQACGKQSKREKSHGCVYTRTTGIWQTVWLERVGRVYIQDLVVEPDPENSRVFLQVEVKHPASNFHIWALAKWQGKIVGKGKVSVRGRHNRLVIPLGVKRLWAVGKPKLYDLEVSVNGDYGDVLAPKGEVTSYFGLRTQAVVGNRFLLNGRPVFQRTVLDQGFYPGGIWTAPTDAALKRDIELSMAAGFNGARLHQKVFEPRFLYWADRLGYLVWGEFPNWGLDHGKPEINVHVLTEWQEILQRDRNHPSIVGWCPFNETPTAAGPLQARVVALTRTLDPTRPVLETSGWRHTVPNPELLDAHDYNQDPVSFRQRWLGADDLPARYRPQRTRSVPFFVSEYGGIGWFGKKAKAWGYGKEPKTLAEFYTRYAGLTNALLDNPDMFGFCYTQLTDIEQERNGIFFYDRRPKFDLARLKAINSRLAAYEKNGEARAGSDFNYTVLVGAAADGELAKPWRFILTAPDSNWATPAFDHSAWQTGKGGFGKKGGWEKFIATPWEGKDIWLRQEFISDDKPFQAAKLILHYDNATEVFLNGKPIWAGKKWNDNYAGFDVTAAVRSNLRPGSNILAVHCHQDDGGQFIDLALLLGRK